MSPRIAPVDALFLHGFNETSAQWDALLGRLAGVVEPCAIDLPGHGRAQITDPTDYSPGAALGMVRNGLAVAGVTPAVCVAHSAAASVAVELAISEPAIERLVLVSPSIEGFPFEGDFGFRLRLVRQAAAADDPNTRFVRQWQLIHGLVAGMATDGTGQGLARLFEALGGSVTLPDAARFTWERLEALNAPVTVLVAEDDFPVYRSHHRALRSRCPQWNWMTVESGGHDLPRTRTDEVAAAIHAALPTQSVA